MSFQITNGHNNPTLKRAETPTATGDNYLTHSRGFASWAFTRDHKRVGMMFLVSIAACLYLGATFAFLDSHGTDPPGAHHYERDDGQDMVSALSVTKNADHTTSPECTTARSRCTGR